MMCSGMYTCTNSHCEASSSRIATAEVRVLHYKVQEYFENSPIFSDIWQIRSSYILNSTESFMKYVSLITLCLSVIAVSFGAEKKFGKKITLKEKTKISAIVANPEQFNGKKVLVEGPIVDVCK